MSEESTTELPTVVPVSIAESYLQGKGLTDGDPSEFDGDSAAQDGKPAPYRAHNFHIGKILVTVYETGPGKVRVEGAQYDEFVQILEGRLILTPDGGEPMEFKQGDSLVVPKGYTGTWEMPEKFRELIVIDTDFLKDSE